MHKTLKAETAQPPAATLAAQQRRFDHFRAEFNHERPHEALGQVVPAAVYAPSPRPYPARLEDPAYARDFELRRVRSNGEIKWQGELIFIAQPLAGEVIGWRENDDGDAGGLLRTGLNSVPSTASLSSSSQVRDRRPAPALETAGRVAHKAHSPRDSSQNPGCGLVDNSPLHVTESAKKCYPNCRIKLLPKLPVAQG